MNRKHKGQKSNDKRTNNDLRNITQKTKTEQQEPHKNRGKLMFLLH
jgi:hypothetical protein